MKIVFSASILATFSQVARAQISLTTTSAPNYSQNFDSLASTGTSSTVPSGWAFTESDTNANTTYSTGDGGSTTGDTYSFGTTDASDRAFGEQRSGSLLSTIGASFTNNTGSSLVGFALAYYGEQWRLGASGRNDRMDFQVSVNATSLTTGTWTDVNALDFVAPISTGSARKLDGNAAANRLLVRGNVTFASAITNGSTFWLRWFDFDATGADDGLGVDDFFLSGRNLVWDGNGVTSPNPSDTDGTWSVTKHWWDSTSSTNVDWSNSAPDNAIFGTGGGASGTVAVTLSTNQTVGTIQFAAASPNYTLSGSGSLTINGTGGITADKSATISVPVKLGNDQTWTVTNNETLSATAAIDANSKVLTKAGPGTLQLSGAAGVLSNASAVTVANGTLALASSVSNRLPTGSSLALGTATTSAYVILGDSSGASDLTLAGLSANATTGNLNRIVGGNSSTRSVLTVDLGSDQSFVGKLGGANATENSLALIKTGVAKLTLSAANTYTGNTQIQQGTLALSGSGSIASSANIIVSSGAKFDVSGVTNFTLASGQKLSGSGQVVGPMKLGTGSTIAPGSSPGTISTDAFSFETDSTYEFEINDATGTAGNAIGWDLINVTGAITVNSTSGNPAVIKVFGLNGVNPGAVAHVTPNTQYVWTIAKGTTAITTFNANKFFINFVNWNTNNSPDGNWKIQLSGDQKEIQLVYVPEPASATLAFAGVGMMLRRRRR